MDKIKVVWICSFSNPEIRDILNLSKPSFVERMIYKMMGRQMSFGQDSAIWNTNAIEEFEKFPEVVLHVVCATRSLKQKEQRFDLRGVNYYFFRDENSSFIRKVKRQLFTKNNALFEENRKTFSRIINEIEPDIVHVMGAENPYYSLAALDVPDNILTIVQLQALLARLVERTDKPEEKVSFAYKGKLEKQIFKKADYLGTSVKEFADYIHQEVKKDAKVLKLSLAMAQKIDLSECKKEFDFVYWSANINKAGEDAIEAYILAYQQNPNITLDVIGGYADDFKAKLISRLASVGAEGSVTFEGLLSTHDDVIRQLRKSRIALLPLKMDFVPNTLREAMANGLPVITTVTEGTPTLNVVRRSALITEQGDYKAMAYNMLDVLTTKSLFDEIRDNGAKTESDRCSNKQLMLQWVEAYKAVLNNKNNETPIPEDLLMR